MTIPKNTKRAKAILAGAKNIKVHSLSNYFQAEPMNESPVIWGGPVVNNQYTQLLPVSQSEYLAHELAIGRHTKLTSDREGHYIIHVHSNLWYEFEN